MPTFVHLAPDKFATRVRRNGIRARKHWIALRPEPVAVRGVYCMPVIGNFFITHQWLREMKRTHPGFKTFVGVYFRVPSSEPVYVGHYNRNHGLKTAGEAVRIVKSEEQEPGYEIVVPRPVGKKEILKIRRLPQVVGWRYYPAAHQSPPISECGVDFGGPKSRKYRERLRREFEDE